MTIRFFLLLERQQKIDALLRLARSRMFENPAEIARLDARSRSVRHRIARAMQRPAARFA